MRVRSPGDRTSSVNVSVQPAAGPVDTYSGHSGLFLKNAKNCLGSFLNVGMLSMSFYLTPEKVLFNKEFKKKVNYYRKRGLFGGRHEVSIPHDIVGGSWVIFLP